MSHAATEATANRIGNVVEQAGQFGIRSAAGNLSVVVEEAPVDYGRIPELNQVSGNLNGVTTSVWCSS